VARISVSYILLCSQVILLLTVLLLQCLEGIHYKDSSDTSGQRATTAAFSEQPQDNVMSYHIIPVECVSYTELYEYRPPVASLKFIHCQDPVDHAQNSTAILEMGNGCWKSKNRMPVLFHSISTLKCFFPKYHSFLLWTLLPCDFRYTGHYFITTLLYSFFLGCFGVDRFCLGHTATAVGKLLTLGGLGIWWFVDLIIIITGGLMPSDNSNWCTFY
uniref:TM2 domain-containing protein 2 n=1 Tax=Hucho hucho TaxID=62062 RepID=A0A4W5QX67_9TELE